MGLTTVTPQPALQIIQQDRQVLEALLTEYSPAMYRAPYASSATRPMPSTRCKTRYCLPPGALPSSRVSAKSHPGWLQSL
jgi:hypothetical protein